MTPEEAILQSMDQAMPEAKQKPKGKKYIYFLYDPTWQSDHFYVGQSTDIRKRVDSHCSTEKLRPDTPKTDWLKCLLGNDIHPATELICEVPDYTDEFEAEKAWEIFLLWCGVKLLNQ